MRVVGLIRLFHRVRDALRDGLPPAEAARLRAVVARAVADVDAVLAGSHRGPGALPPASRNAWRFLKTADLAAIPRPAAEPRRELTVRGASAEMDDWARRLWMDPDGLSEEGAAASLTAGIEGRIRRLEADCRSLGLDPTFLRGPARSLYCWLRWLGDGGLPVHLAALGRARDAGARLAAGLLEVYLVPLGSLWRAVPVEDGLRVRVAEGFVGADEATWHALLTCAVRPRTRGAQAAVRRYAESEAFREVGAVMDALAAPPGSPRGRVHDLDAAFDRVNALCFGGALVRPRLAWSRMPTSYLLGTWRPGLGQVSLSVLLDDEKVPEFVVDYLLYHELLHMVHGATWDGHRRQVHTREFREAEARFPRAAEAEVWVRRM